MLKQLTKRMRDRTVVTTAILSLMGNHVYAGDVDRGGPERNKKTESPIKHVIVIVGENRTFDHIFATYKARNGEFVDNLLSKGIIKDDGSQGPNFSDAAQNTAQATDPAHFELSPGGKALYSVLPAPNTDSAPTAACVQEFEKLKRQSDEYLAHWAEIQRTDLAAFEKTMAGQNIQAIVVPAAGESVGSGGEEPR